MTKMTMPRLGEDTVAAIVLRAMVAKGDQVEEGDPIAELETDKATTEVPSTVSGEIVEILFEEGQEVHEGDALVTVDDGSEAGESAPEGKPAKTGGPASEAAPEEPDDAASREDVQRDRSGSEAPRSHAVSEGPSGSAGSRHGEPEPRHDVPVEPSEDPPRPQGDRIVRQPRATPSVRALAMELGVELEDVAGTGDYGRIIDDDVKSHVRHLLQGAVSHTARRSRSSRSKLSTTRRRIAENVARSWSRVVHVTQHDEADITGLTDAMSRLSDELDAPVTLTSLIAAVTARILTRFEAINASLDLDAGERLLHRRVHLGIAVDTERGLLVPVLHDADRKGVGPLSTELTELAGAARDGSIEAAQMQGATFSISNLGGLGTTTFTPIVPWPQVGILSVGRASTRPVWQDDRFVPRTIVPLGITYDHRALDGADAARFLRAVATTLEQPLRLLLG